MKKLFLIASLLGLACSLASAQSNINRETLVYSVKDGKALHLDKYVDNTIEYPGKRPVIIYVHGGGFSMGSRINALQIQYCKHFAAQGYVAIAMDYRLGITPNTQPDQQTIMKAISVATRDLVDATAFVIGKSKEWNIDPEKIIISGGSAGAITCLTAEYNLCSKGELSNLLPKDFNYAGIISHAGAVIVKEDSLRWKKMPCPMLLMHGDKDQLVPFNSYVIEGNLYAGSNYIHQQLNKLDAPHWLYEEVGADHIVALKPLQYNFAEIDGFTDMFIYKGQKVKVHTIWEDEKPDSMADLQKVVPLYIIGWGKTDEELEVQKK